MNESNSNEPSLVRTHNGGDTQQQRHTSLCTERRRGIMAAGESRIHDDDVDVSLSDALWEVFDIVTSMGFCLSHQCDDIHKVVLSLCEHNDRGSCSFGNKYDEVSTPRLIGSSTRTLSPTDISCFTTYSGAAAADSSFAADDSGCDLTCPEMNRYFSGIEWEHLKPVTEEPISFKLKWTWKDFSFKLSLKAKYRSGAKRVVWSRLANSDRE